MGLMFKIYKVFIHLTSENDFKIGRGTEQAFFKKKKTPYRWSRISKMQIGTTKKYYLIPVGITVIKRKGIRVGKDVEKMTPCALLLRIHSCNHCESSSKT